MWPIIETPFNFRQQLAPIEEYKMKQYLMEVASIYGSLPKPMVHQDLPPKPNEYGSLFLPDIQIRTVDCSVFKEFVRRFPMSS